MAVDPSCSRGGMGRERERRIEGMAVAPPPAPLGRSGDASNVERKRAQREAGIEPETADNADALLPKPLGHAAPAGGAREREEREGEREGVAIIYMNIMLNFLKSINQRYLYLKMYLGSCQQKMDYS